MDLMCVRNLSCGEIPTHPTPGREGHAAGRMCQAFGL